MYVTPPCPLCGSESRQPVYPATRPATPPSPEELACATATLATYDAVVRCLSCGVLYTCPRPTNDHILSGYRDMADKAFLGEAKARELTYRGMLHSLDKLTGGKKGRLLDAGCAMGFFLQQARAAGWEVEGLDASEWAAGYARDTYGLKVQTGPIRAAKLEPASYDVITIWDVVEHLLDPVEDFKHLAAALKPGGVFALSTHSIGSLSARLLGPRYPFLMAMHVIHFTPKTTGLLLEKAGLKQVRIHPHVRWLRLGYFMKKLGQRLPRTAAILGWPLKALGLFDRYIPITGLGIFEAYAVKER